MDFLKKLREEARAKPRTIIFPEGKDAKIMEAAWKLVTEGLVKQAMVVGTQADLQAAAAACGADLARLQAIVPEQDSEFAAYVDEYFELRKHKNITREFAAEQMKKTHYWAAMAVRRGRADGMVAGINSETKPFLPSFEIIKTKPGISKVSSFFFEVFPDKVLFYADCAVNIDPDEDTLAEIAVSAARSARQFWHEPRVAMLSFSTRDSAKHPFVDKMKNATAKARALAAQVGLDVVIDGEIQFDAAFLPAVAAKKAPDSPFVQQGANVFVFPDLNAGNIAYKMTERLAGAQAFGPILQGLNKPVNDLSRGAKVDDILNVALITSIQASSQ